MSVIVKMCFFLIIENCTSVKHKILFCAIFLLLFISSGKAYERLPEPLSGKNCNSSLEDWDTVALNRGIRGQLGLPVVAHPPDNLLSKEKIKLGRKLFFDRRLSINKTMSCGMCHVPEHAFTNWEMQTAVGVEGRSVKRNAPSLLNVGFQKVLFHDGRDSLLETQFVGPLVARNEMANPSVGLVITLLRDLVDYQDYFLSAFGGQATLDRVGMALGAYQRTLIAGRSPFDLWYFGKDEDVLTPAQKRGFEIFTGKAGCASCHLIEEGHALFTDNLFHDTGYGWMRERDRQYPRDKMEIQVAPGVFVEMENDKIMAVGNPAQSDLGRYEVTEKTQDRWKFRTSSLRNIAVTRPFMHDGGLQTLADVIKFYNQGGPMHALQDIRIRPLNLTNAERNDLERFLESLTSEGISCLIAEARTHKPDNHRGGM